MMPAGGNNPSLPAPHCPQLVPDINLNSHLSGGGLKKSSIITTDFASMRRFFQIFFA